MAPSRGYGRTVPVVAVRCRTFIGRLLVAFGPYPIFQVRRSTATTSRLVCSRGHAVVGSTGMVIGTTASGRITPAVGATRDVLGQVP